MEETLPVLTDPGGKPGSGTHILIFAARGDKPSLNSTFRPVVVLLLDNGTGFAGTVAGHAAENGCMKRCGVLHPASLTPVRVLIVALRPS
jgi:hypothetical protein